MQVFGDHPPKHKPQKWSILAFQGLIDILILVYSTHLKKKKQESATFYLLRVVTESKVFCFVLFFYRLWGEVRKENWAQGEKTRPAYVKSLSHHSIPY